MRHAVPGAVSSLLSSSCAIRAETMNEFLTRPEGLAVPDMPDALVGDGRVNDCIGDRPVPHEGLQGPGINAAPRKGCLRIPEMRPNAE